MCCCADAGAGRWALMGLAAVISLLVGGKVSCAAVAVAWGLLYMADSLAVAVAAVAVAAVVVAGVAVVAVLVLVVLMLMLLVLACPLLLDVPLVLLLFLLILFLDVPLVACLVPIAKNPMAV